MCPFPNQVTKAINRSQDASRLVRRGFEATAAINRTMASQARRCIQTSATAFLSTPKHNGREKVQCLAGGFGLLAEQSGAAEQEAERAVSQTCYDRCHGRVRRSSRFQISCIRGKDFVVRWLHWCFFSLAREGSVHPAMHDRRRSMTGGLPHRAG